MDRKIKCMAVYNAVDMILTKLNAEMLNELLAKFQHVKRSSKDNVEIKEIIVQAIRAETAARVCKKRQYKC